MNGNTICIISYYELKDALRCAADALENLGYTITNYPLFQHAHDKNSKIKDYPNHFKSYLQHNKPEIILWWYIGIPAEVMDFVYKDLGYSPFSILFNWDDPWTWIIQSNQLAKKCKHFDLTVGTCIATVEKYIENGAKDAIYSVPGFDEKVYFPMQTEKVVDVTFCCTNLYEDKTEYSDQYIVRKKLVDDLYKENVAGRLSFHIYGPEFLKNRYPLSYKGYLNYNDCNKVFNSSKINLCTHVCKSYDGYINERAVLILASGGLLLIDYPKGVAKFAIPGEECILLDQNNYIKQIHEILRNRSTLDHICRNAVEKSKLYTWKKWAEKVVSRIPKRSNKSLPLSYSGCIENPVVFPGRKMSYKKTIELYSGMMKVSHGEINEGLHILQSIIDGTDDETIILHLEKFLNTRDSLF